MGCIFVYFYYTINLELQKRNAHNTGCIYWAFHLPDFQLYSKQLLDGKPWNLLQTFMFSSGWIITTLVVPWPFIYRHIHPYILYRHRRMLWYPFWEQFLPGPTWNLNTCSTMKQENKDWASERQRVGYRDKVRLGWWLHNHDIVGWKENLGELSWLDR